MFRFFLLFLLLASQTVCKKKNKLLHWFMNKRSPPARNYSPSSSRDRSPPRELRDQSPSRSVQDEAPEVEYDPEDPYIGSINSHNLDRLLQVLRTPQRGFEKEQQRNAFYSRSYRKKPEEQRKLFVCNIAFTPEKDELESIFASCGALQELNLFQRTDAHGRPKSRYAFVTYERTEDAQNALFLNGKLVDGRELNVRMARPHKKNNGGRQ